MQDDARKLDKLRLHTNGTVVRWSGKKWLPHGVISNKRFVPLRQLMIEVSR